MKSLLAFALLLAAASALLAATSALSLDALREMLSLEYEKKSISLKDYLDSLEEPHPLYRSERNSLICATGCAATPVLDAGATCAGAWRPNYEANDAGCQCLTGYKCCNGTCPTLNKEGCWGEGDVDKGKKYATIITDCCDCQVAQCIGCPAPAPRADVCPSVQPADCYTYTPNSTFDEDETKCYVSGCAANPSDAPDNEACDARCQNVVPNLSHCGFAFTTCAAARGKIACPRVSQAAARQLLNPTPLICYEEPTEIVDENGGFFYDGASAKCAQCTKWDYEFKSCAAKNQEAATMDCHMSGQDSLDRKCFEKMIRQDQCGCDYGDCVLNRAESADEFEAGEVCPGGHVKMSGVSICLHPRDVCKRCPDYVAIAASDCPQGKVEETEDCNGCRISKCARATVPVGDCSCHKYVLDVANNVLTCDCGPLKWFCAVKFGGSVVLKTTDLAAAQGSLGVGNAQNRQAIIPMTDNASGDPHTLTKSWVGGSMWWYNWPDIRNMQATCRGAGLP